MADLISTLTTDVQTTFADLTTTVFERYVNQIHNMVLVELGIRDTTTDLTLTAGTRSYTLPETAIEVKAATYIRSSTANDHTALRATTEEAMDLADPNWRERDVQGTPFRFFVTSSSSSNNTVKKITLDPIPDTTSSGGYPNVRLAIVQNVTLVSTDTIPVEMSNSQVYLDGAKWLHCKNTRREQEAEYWYAQFRKSMDYEVQYHRNRITNNPGRINLAGFVKGARVV
ncbi:MAG TPA: hypothetical protein DCP69_01580 [Candidatus Omnitrophica bacterium]|nr:hypothetical protein [Candidatus Omnitrophota bacterium]